MVMFLCGVVSAKRTANTTISCSFWKWENLLPILFFAVIFGLRYDVGQDHLSYLFSYKNGGGYIERYEPIFKFVTSEFGEFGLHPFWYFGLWAFIQIFFVYYALKDERFLMPFVAIVLIMGQFFMQWMNGIRQELASCIFFFSVIYIIDKKFIKYLLCCLLSLCFHKTAIFVLLLYPLLFHGKDLTINRLFQAILLSLACVVVILDTNLFQYIELVVEIVSLYLGYDVYTADVIETYIDKTVAGDGILWKLLFLINLVVIYYSKIMKQYFQGRKFTIYYNLFFWGAFFELLFMNNLVLQRPFRYLKLFNLLLIAYLLYYLYNKRTPMNFVMFIVLLVLLLMMFYITIKYWPFNFLWDFNV